MNSKPNISSLIIAVAIVIGFVIHAFILSEPSKPRTTHELCYEVYDKTTSGMEGEDRVKFLMSVCGNR